MVLLLLLLSLFHSNDGAAYYASRNLFTHTTSTPRTPTCTDYVKVDFAFDTISDSVDITIYCSTNAKWFAIGFPSTAQYFDRDLNLMNGYAIIYEPGGTAREYNIASTSTRINNFTLQTTQNLETVVPSVGASDVTITLTRKLDTLDSNDFVFDLTSMIACYPLLMTAAIGDSGTIVAGTSTNEFASSYLYVYDQAQKDDTNSYTVTWDNMIQVPSGWSDTYLVLNVSLTMDPVTETVHGLVQQTPRGGTNNAVQVWGLAFPDLADETFYASDPIDMMANFAMIWGSKTATCSGNTWLINEYMVHYDGATCDIYDTPLTGASWTKCVKEITSNRAVDQSAANNSAVNGVFYHRFDIAFKACGYHFSPAEFQTCRPVTMTSMSTTQNNVACVGYVNLANAGPQHSYGKTMIYDFPTPFPTKAPTSAPSRTPTAPSNHPSTTPTKAPTKPPTSSPTAPTNAPTFSPTLAPTDAPSYSPSQAPTKPPSAAPSGSPSQPPTAAPSQPPTDAPSLAPSYSPTDAPSFSPTDTPTAAPSYSPTDAPSFAPSDAPSAAPSYSPTDAPSYAPTDAPSAAPSYSPTDTPSSAPSDAPSAAPSHPTSPPTFDPTTEPTWEPTSDPTQEPTQDPTWEPTLEPTTDPTKDPTADPTADPTKDPTADPTADPTKDPTADPTKDPTKDPTTDPTRNPTGAPTWEPTTEPTWEPTWDPTKDPTADPTADPTKDPTVDPTTDPTRDPTQEPTTDPTKDPTADPTADPTTDPTLQPTLAPTETCLTMVVKIINIWHGEQKINESTQIVSVGAGNGGRINISHEHWNGHYLENVAKSFSRPTWSKDSSLDLPDKDGLISWRPTSWRIHSGITGHELLYLNDRGLHPPTRQLSHWVFYLNYNVTFDLELECSDSVAPTAAPSYSPTTAPTETPSNAPTNAPTSEPTDAPSQSPSAVPTYSPSDSPTLAPVVSPTAAPSYSPTDAPTDDPTTAPTGSPSQPPTFAPTTYCELMRVRVIDVLGSSDTASDLEMYQTEFDSSFEQLTSSSINYRTHWLRLSDRATIQYDDETMNWVITGPTDILSISSTAEQPPASGTWSSSANPDLDIVINTQCAVYTDNPTMDPTTEPTSDPTMEPTTPSLDPTVTPTSQPTTASPTTAAPTRDFTPPAGSCGAFSIELAFTIFANTYSEAEIREFILSAFADAVQRAANRTWDNTAWCVQIKSLSITPVSSERRRLLQEDVNVVAELTVGAALYTQYFSTYDQDDFNAYFEEFLFLYLVTDGHPEQSNNATNNGNNNNGNNGVGLGAFTASNPESITTTAMETTEVSDDNELPLGLGNTCPFGLACWILYTIFLALFCFLLIFVLCFCRKTKQDVERAKFANKMAQPSSRNIEMQGVATSAPASPASPAPQGTSPDEEAAEPVLDKQQTTNLDI